MPHVLLQEDTNIDPQADDSGRRIADAVPMTATSTTKCHGCKCHGCSALVDCAQHLPLCDSCLDARLAALERFGERPSKRTGTLRWPGGWRGALAVGDALRVAA
jgi:hypothetical protein